MGIKKILALVSLATLALVALTIGVYVSFYMMGDRALPNTYIGKTNVDGLTKSEIQALINSSTKENTVAIYGNGVTTTTATLNEMGFSVNSQDAAADAVAANDSWINYAKAPFQRTFIDPEILIDEDKAFEFAATLTAENKDTHRPVNPKVEFIDDQFTMTPGKDGQGVKFESLKEPAKQLIANQSNVRYEATITKVQPQIEATEIESKAQVANQLIAPEVIVNGEDESFTASPSEKAAWINLEGTSPTLNISALNDWVAAKASEAESEGQKGYRYVASNGDQLRVLTEAVSATTVTNQTEVAGDILSGLKSHTAISVDFTIETMEAEWDEKTIARGAEYLAYPAAEGEKWVDVSLSGHRVTAYIGATAQATYPMVSGAPGYRTPPGQYRVWGKNRLQDMRGYNNDGTPYLTENVPYATYFYGDYALHGSSAWRSTWGYDAGAGGSHGCINMPDEGAAFIFNFAPVGTPVIVHY